MSEVMDTAVYMLEHLHISSIHRSLSSCEKHLKLSRCLSTHFEEEQDARDRAYWERELLSCRIAADLYKFLPKRRIEGDKLDANELKSKISMTQVAERYTTLTGNGRGKCPVHGGDKQNSFSVIRAKQIGYCFACGWVGDVIKLVMDMEKLDFQGAMEFLKNEYT
jgi:hypothetical protein